MATCALKWSGLPQIHRPQVPDRAAGCDRLGRGHDGVRVDAVVAIEVANLARLAEMLDAERTHPVPAHGPEPRERCRMPIEDRDDAAMGRHLGEEPLDVAARANAAAL